MSNDAMTFDADALKKRVSQTVQNTFGMLIPDSEFQSMVEREVKAYFETQTKFLFNEERRSNGSTWDGVHYMNMYATMTPFRRQVWEAVADRVKTYISTFLGGEEFRAMVYQTGDGMASTELSLRLEAKLNEIAPKMAANAFREIFVSAVATAKCDVMNDIANKIK